MLQNERFVLDCCVHTYKTNHPTNNLKIPQFRNLYSNFKNIVIVEFG